MTMKRNILHNTRNRFIGAFALMATVMLVLCGCSEEIFMPGSQEGEKTTISLSYADVSPRGITINSRATDAEERRLDNLYIYIFGSDGNLRGYKEVTSGLDQNTSNNNQATISGINTRTGDAYIYAVANISTGLYPVSTSEGKVEDGKLPIGLNEKTAQNGGYSFTKEQFLNLPFQRNNTGTIQISSAFLMSGSINSGQAVNIPATGTLTDTVIKLNRIVSKVKFTIKAAAASGNITSRSFKLSTYDIMNISIDGKLIGTTDGNSRYSAIAHSSITGNTRNVNDVDTEGREFFECYLPENLQTKKADANTWHAREDDSQTTSKEFTNAPSSGTYVVLKGKYSEEKNDGTTKTADVTYYVHLGEWSASDYNNYDVERNSKYTYNITVEGVDKIVAEAKKETGQTDQPGAEGVVLEYGTAGKNLVLDSHYEYMVMRFYQNDIKTLKDSGHGYYYQVQTINGKTDAMEVKDQETGSTNGVDTDWIEFAIGSGKSDKSTYSTVSTERGTACKYPGWTNSKMNEGLYSIVDFLKLLYNKANENSFWSSGTDTSKGKYIDATCFVSENYYSGKTWDQYVNTDPRSFYVANEVKTSNDGRSIYAKAAYGLQQYSIQTFYNRSKSSELVAYGCETINDEEGKGFTDNGGDDKAQDNTYGTDTWHGRANMLQDIFQYSNPRYKWAQLENNKSLVKACMSRNRDLNGDGKISEDELRWYAPTINQYAGLWIGEDIISTESKLFNRSTSTLSKDNDPKCRMLYYASTSGTNTFFAEEGMATNNHKSEYPATYVRCVRNLKSNNIGYAETPAKYYTYTESDKKVSLENVDENALNTTGEQGELNAHTERSEGNKPASAFYIANNTHSSKKTAKITSTQQNVVNGTFKCYNSYNQDDKNWRVPNQREMSLMVLIDPDLVNNTYCRTVFSNTDFRKSWTYSDVFTMKEDVWNKNGSVRCIKVTK